MTTSFKSIDRARSLQVQQFGPNVLVTIEYQGNLRLGITLDRPTITKLVVEMLEKSGWPEPDPTSVTHTILDDLSRVIQIQAALAMNDPDQAQLEFEALELRNEYLGTNDSSWDQSVPASKDRWVRMALKAREMWGSK